MSAPASVWGHPADRYLFALAHWFAPLIVVLICIDIANHYIDTVVSQTAVWVMLTVTVVAMLSEFRHDRSVCWLCYDVFPLDAAGQAKGKRRSALRAYHLIADRPKLMPLAQLATIVSSFWVWWVFDVLWALFFILAWGGYWHRLLGPWCPYCRHGGRGPHECVPEPTPDPSVVATR